MQRGRKPDCDRWDDLDLHFLAKYPEGSPERVIRFIERFVCVPDGYGAGAPLRLRRWQAGFVRGAYGPGVRVACFSVARGNGKTVLTAAINLSELYTAEPGAHLYAAASSERQAGRLMEAARDMVAASPELAARTIPYADKLEVRYSGSTLETVPATSKSLQGLRGRLLTLDEAAEVDDSTFEALSLSLGKIPDSRLLCISTAPISEDHFWNRLRDAGQAGTDDTLHWTEFSAPEGADPADPATWKMASPAMDDFLDRSAILSDYRKVRAEAFERWRLNRCTSSAGAWIPWGQFERLAQPERRIPAGARVVLGFDGSVNTDSTALVAVTISPEPFCELLGLWERPAGVRDWSVDRGAVEAAVEAAMAKYDVAELVADPHWWQSEIQAWEVRWPNRVLTFGTHIPQRMTKACDAAYALISEGRMHHSGDPRLQAHVRNCVVRQTSAGAVVTKDHKNSTRKIDAAIALIIGVDRAIWHANQPAKRNRVFVGSYV